MSPGDLLFSIVFSTVCQSCSVMWPSQWSQSCCVSVGVIMFKNSGFSMLCRIEVFVECVS